MATFLRHVPRADRIIIRRQIRDEEEPVPVFKSKLPGDPITLRGIPAIGRGVSGAIRDTQPDRVV